MDTRILLGVLGVFVVLFFAYQWWSVSSRRRVSVPTQKASVSEPTANSVEGLAPNTGMPAVEQQPEMPGRTEQEVLMKEPVQERRIGGQQLPVTDEGHGPAEFGDNLRHPENLFHQPQAAGGGSASDVASGRAASTSAPLVVHQQPFSPEFAQNGGALIGNSMFAYDGMEPTEFSSF